MRLCCPRASAKPCPVMHRNKTLIPLIQAPPLNISKNLHRMTNMTQSLPRTWPRLSYRIPAKCARDFLLSRSLFLPGPEPRTQQTSSPPTSTPTTSATPLSAVTRPAAWPGTDKRQVGTLLANRTAQYQRRRVPARNAGADLGGYRKSCNSSFRKASEALSRVREVGPWPYPSHPI